MKETQTAGRGSNKNNSRTHTQITTRLPNELLKRIEGYARAEGRSRSNAIERLLSRFFKEGE
jgi:metal-responsive CopG/Arc/MetJ family transcriptional regulator